MLQSKKLPKLFVKTYPLQCSRIKKIPQNKYGNLKPGINYVIHAKLPALLVIAIKGLLFLQKSIKIFREYCTKEKYLKADIMPS